MVNVRIYVVIVAVTMVCTCVISTSTRRPYRDFIEVPTLRNRLRSVKKFTPKGSVFPVDSYHGYVPVTQNGDDIFYWMFPPKNGKTDAPVLFWIPGGPGCSSEMSALLENGPFNVTKDGKIFLNPYGWNDQAYLVFIDQPIGTGLSHSSVDDMAQTENQVADNMLTFFKSFFSDIFPEFKNRPLFLSGVSFAGNYLPHIANRLYKEKLSYINLQGIAIGNGWTNPSVQYLQYAEFAHAPENVDKTKLSDADYQRITPLLRSCGSMLKNSPASMVQRVNAYCEGLLEQIISDDKGPKFNQYDIRGPCTIEGSCYDMSAQTAFINSPEVMNELESNKVWTSWSDVVAGRLNNFDGNNDASGKLIDILNEAKVRVLVYSGDQDLSCNWMGGQAWLEGLKWNRQQDFLSTTFVKESTYGEARTVGQLKFLKVFNAGHMVSMDNSPDALTMINQFMTGWSVEERQVE